VRDVAQDVHSQLGDVDEEVEVEDRTHFAIINPRTAAPTVAVSSISITLIIVMNRIPLVYKSNAAI